MPLDINTLIQDYNGSAMSIAGHAEWGYVPKEWYIAIPQGANAPENYAVGTTPFDANLTATNFLKANFHHVRQAAGSNEVALFTALMRMHLANNGILTRSIANRSVIEDEYVTVNHGGASWNAEENNIPDIPSSGSMAKFVKHHGNTLVHMMVYVFSARGHHWDPNYNDLYDRLKRACFITGNFGFTLPNNETLFRLIVHGFGIKPLLDMTLADRAAGRMASAMILRFSPTAPIAGVAHVTTLNAALRSMEQEPWWQVFEAKFHNEITAIRTEVDAVHHRTYDYHVAAKVFGRENRQLVSADATNAFNALCQYALGYIDHLGRRNPLSGQQAISQKSGGPRGIADSFAKACDRFGKPNADVASMADFLSQV